MSPIDDKFLSGSLDQTIRLWDLRHPVCLGLMNLTGRPVANFDPEGLIFAAGIGSETIKLYDLRSFEKVINYIYFYKKKYRKSFIRKVAVLKKKWKIRI